jgi:hypothetical protein
MKKIALRRQDHEFTRNAATAHDQLDHRAVVARGRGRRDRVADFLLDLKEDAAIVSEARRNISNDARSAVDHRCDAADRIAWACCVTMGTSSPTCRVALRFSSTITPRQISGTPSTGSPGASALDPRSRDKRQIVRCKITIPRTSGHPLDLIREHGSSTTRRHKFVMPTVLVTTATPLKTFMNFRNRRQAYGNSNNPFIG